MTKQVTIKLTKAEIEHILRLIELNKSEEIYSGLEKTYWKRTLRIFSKLKLAQAKSKNK